MGSSTTVFFFTLLSYNTIWHQGREDHPRWNDKHRHKNCCHKPRGFQHSTHTVMSTLQSDAPTQLSTWQKYYAIILPHSAKVQSPQLRNRPPQQILRNPSPQQTLRNRPHQQALRNRPPTQRVSYAITVNRRFWKTTSNVV